MVAEFRIQEILDLDTNPAALSERRSRVNTNFYLPQRNLRMYSVVFSSLSVRGGGGDPHVTTAYLFKFVHLLPIHVFIDEPTVGLHLKGHLTVWKQSC